MSTNLRDMNMIHQRPRHSMLRLLRAIRVSRCRGPPSLAHACDVACPLHSDESLLSHPLTWENMGAGTMLQHMVEMVLNLDFRSAHRIASAALRQMCIDMCRCILYDEREMAHARARAFTYSDGGAPD